MKATDEELRFSYKKHKSVWKVGKEFGMCGQSVHARLQKMKIKLKGSKFTERERDQIRERYSGINRRGQMTVKALAVDLGREYTSIVREARKMGLTTRRRKMNDELKDALHKERDESFKKNGHPKGMLGKKHSLKVIQDMKIRFAAWWRDATVEEINKKMKKSVMTARNNGVYNRKHGSWKSAWRTIGGKRKYFRSRWEANYARYLEFLKKKGCIKDWLHEPQTFWFESIKRGVRSYLPDFKVINNDETHFWVEVKGWMDDKSKTKIKRFRKYYPDEELQVKDSNWFKKNAKKIALLCEGWETKHDK